MKTTTLVILCVYTCINTFGQNFNRVIITGRVPGESKDNKIFASPSYTDLVHPQKLKNEEKLSPLEYYRSCLLKKFKVQRLNSHFLITGGSVIGFSGNLPVSQVSAGNIFTGKTFHTSRNEYKTRSGLALTGLAIIAGNISSFINSLKIENKAGLKLTCQKSSFGAPNKACKKVTGLTFAVSI